MITGPLIITWAVGGAVGAAAGIAVRHLWKRVTHTEAQVAQLKLDAPPNEGQSL